MACSAGAEPVQKMVVKGKESGTVHPEETAYKA